MPQLLRRGPSRQDQLDDAPPDDAPPELSPTVVCAWCKAKERTGDTWEGLKTDPNAPNVSHGICPDCYVREREKLKRKRK